MLRRLKTAVQQQHHDKSSTATTVNEHSTDNESQSFNEGLVCPECRKAFETIDSLQTHYQSLHGMPTVVENGANQSNIDRISSADQSNEITSITDSVALSNRRPVERSVSNLSSFVCPQCFQELQSAEALQSHFLAIHNNEVSDDRNVDILAMRQEMNDLRATLKEEKRYAIEMRKEVDKLQNLFEQKSSAGVTPSKSNVENEAMYYLQQIQMLEAGKSLVTTKMLDLEKQVADLTRSNEGLVREKDRVVEKSINLAREHAQVRSLYDEECSQRAAQESRILELHERIRDLESELNQRPSDDDVAVLRKELIHAQTLMNDMAQEKERETSEWVSKCSDLENKCKERDGKIADLLRQLEENGRQDDESKKILNDQMQVEIGRCKDLEAQIGKFEMIIAEQAGTVDKLHDKIATLTSNVEDMEHAKIDLQEQLRLANETESKLRSEIETRVNEANDHARCFEEFEAKIKRLVAEKEELLQAVKMDNSAETALAQSAAENARLMDNLRDLENQFASFKTESIVEVNRRKSELIEKSTTIADLQKQVSVHNDEKSKLDDQKAALDQEFHKLKSNINEKEGIISSLGSALKELEQKLDESKHFETSAHESIIKLTKLREELDSSEQKWKEERLRLTTQLDELNEKCIDSEDQLHIALMEQGRLSLEHQGAIEALETRVASLTSEKVDLTRSREDASQLYAQEKLALEEKLNQISSALETEKSRCRFLEKINNELEEEIVQLKNAHEKFVAENGALIKEVEVLKNNLVKMTNEEDYLKKELIEKAGEISNLHDEKQSVSRVKEELADALKATEQQAADLRTQLTKVEDILRTTREETRAILREKQDQLEKLTEEYDQLSAEKLSSEANASVEISTLKEERKRSQDQIDDLKNMLEERNRIFESVLATKLQLEESVAKIEKEKDIEVAERQEKVNALSSERDTLIIEKQKYEVELQRLRSNLEEINSTLTDLRAKAETEREASTKQINELRDKLEEAKAENQRIREDNTTKEAAFEKQLGSLTDSLSDLRAQLASRISLLDEESTKNVALEKRIRELERTTVELQDEKRSLLERCLQNDKYIEEEKDNCREIQRRLDDAISAMHELGREHQSFQMDINRHYNRKWADDSLVHQCMKCSKQFSVTIRKHHCRNCGLIFCADCSNKASHVGASKKPVRVCDSCYNELQSR